MRILFRAEAKACPSDTLSKVHLGLGSFAFRDRLSVYTYEAARAEFPVFTYFHILVLVVARTDPFHGSSKAPQLHVASTDRARGPFEIDYMIVNVRTGLDVAQRSFVHLFQFFTSVGRDLALTSLDDEAGVFTK